MMCYSELITTSNYSFLRSGSHPEELVEQAAHLGYSAIGITDYLTLGGVVRAHVAAKRVGIQLIIGVQIPMINSHAVETDVSQDAHCIVIYPRSRAGYSALSRALATYHQNQRDGEGSTNISSLYKELSTHSSELLVLIPGRSLYNENDPADQLLKPILSVYGNNSIYIGISYYHDGYDEACNQFSSKIAEAYKLPLVATNNVLFHHPDRKRVLDVLTCVRLKKTLLEAGKALEKNFDRGMRAIPDTIRIFSDFPASILNTDEFRKKVNNFTLDQLAYEYPESTSSEGLSQFDELIKRTLEGAQHKYPQGIPESVQTLLEQEFSIIQELHYEKYFLTCHDIVQFARERMILCQGRGAAANSVVCFCLGITVVDPTKADLLFARFVSKERQEPPDIDIDFEHERREEIIQFIYERYGIQHAALTSSIITYRRRSAVRDVAKVFGCDAHLIDTLVRLHHSWSSSGVTTDLIGQLGINTDSGALALLFAVSRDIIGFPRHRSQHVGGFIISKQPLNEIVPIIPASMDSRFIIEWDKDDIESLGILKIDILALGILTCIRKCISFVNARRVATGEKQVQLGSIPIDDPDTYVMMGKSDTIGVFQIESRAQMAMLPRMKPRCYYDVVIEIALVRPGPIHGNMVHPYLRRREGIEKVAFPDDKVRSILGKTLGIPLFQEQAMRLAIVLAGFSPGEAEQLRRAMGTWKRHERIIEEFRQKIVAGMKHYGYSQEFAETCMDQIKGFSEYGFPESHAASFAYLVIASAWLKCHYPGEFAAALLNSQPMGFYGPSQILDDAKRHSIILDPVDINRSHWEYTPSPDGSRLQIGFQCIKGFQSSESEKIVLLRDLAGGSFDSIEDLWSISLATPEELQLTYGSLVSLARSGAFSSLGMTIRQALWKVKELPRHPEWIAHSDYPLSHQYLPQLTVQEQVYQEYQTKGYSTEEHLVSFSRESLTQEYRCVTGKDLTDHQRIPGGTFVSVGGIVISRQRPPTAKGVVFLSIEDETGITNIIVPKFIFERYPKQAMFEQTLVIRGKVQRIGPVNYLIASELRSFSMFRSLRIDPSYGCKSY